MPSCPPSRPARGSGAQVWSSLGRLLALSGTRRIYRTGLGRAYRRGALHPVCRRRKLAAHIPRSSWTPSTASAGHEEAHPIAGTFMRAVKPDAPGFGRTCAT